MTLKIARCRRYRTGSREVASFHVPHEHRDAYAELIRQCKGFLVDVEFSTPRKERTTGKNSQNHTFNSMIAQIANETGNDFADVKTYVKRRAFRRGLPFLTRADGSVVYSMIDGEPLPMSEADMSTVECGWCIDEAMVTADDFGIKLREVSGWAAKESV